jgi:hypothetical protein
MPDVAPNMIPPPTDDSDKLLVSGFTQKTSIYVRLLEATREISLPGEGEE